MKKIFAVLAFFLIAVLTAPVFAADSNARDTNNVCAYFFYTQDCPHCVNVDAALKSVQAKYSNFDVNNFDINSPGATELLHELYIKPDYLVPKYVVDSQGNYIPVWDKTPVLFIGKEYRIGDFAMIDKWIESQVLKHATKGLPCPDQNLEAYPDENINFPDQNFPAGTDQNTGSGNGGLNIPDNTTFIIAGIGIVILIAAIVLALRWRKEPEENKAESESPEKIAEALAEENKEPGKKSRKAGKNKAKKEENPIEGA
ncbi:MAG: hypothetical protein PHD95_02750 [Candidatus ainarchaeum sp.]|nr:hypothetical protein [Candidatus ainarchaeum sp.]